ncbi:UNVERIFIED_CONTAM: hypothetical protein GTU68_042448 [Idotea baltica]|nr:hypothetical protein [Idotea baltica]
MIPKVMVLSLKMVQAKITLYTFLV